MRRGKISMDTAKVGPLPETSLPGRIEEMRKRIQQELLAQENASSVRPFIMYYLKRWGIVHDDEDASGQALVHSHPWHDWYHSDRP
jgi:hypothetical protein